MNLYEIWQYCYDVFPVSKWVVRSSGQILEGLKLMCEWQRELSVICCTCVVHHTEPCQTTVREELWVGDLDTHFQGRRTSERSWWHFQKQCHLLFNMLILNPSFFCFQIIDEDETQFMTNCAPAVTESTPRRRTRIQVLWTAPPSGAGCVILKWVSFLSNYAPTFE